MTDTWIFQAEPKDFDLRAALKKSNEHGRIIMWLVSRNREEVQPGHRVYMWAAGAAGGPIAVTTVLTVPTVSTIDEWQLECAINRARFASADWRVRLRIDRILPRPIGRNELKRHPELEDLSILKFWQATVFPVSPDQAALLARLTTRPAPARLRPPVHGVATSLQQAQPDCGRRVVAGGDHA